MGVNKMRDFGVAFEELCRQHKIKYELTYSSDGIEVKTTFKGRGSIGNEEIVHNEVTFNNLSPDLEPAKKPAKKVTSTKKKRGK